MTVERVEDERGENLKRQPDMNNDQTTFTKYHKNTKRSKEER